MDAMDTALASLANENGEGRGPIEVMLRQQDFNTPAVETPQGAVSVPAQALIAFTADSFRRITLSSPHSDPVWEFVVLGPSGQYDQRMYVAGYDILFVRVSRRVL